MATLRVNLVQIKTRSDQAANVAAIERLVAGAARGARFVMLPLA